MFSTGLVLLFLGFVMVNVFGGKYTISITDKIGICFAGVGINLMLASICIFLWKYMP